MDAGYPHVRVRGEAAERGRLYGEGARERIGRSLAAYEAVFRHYAGWDWRTVTAEARRFEEPIGEFDRRYLDELRGVADGAGVEFDDVLALNVRTEIMFSAKAKQAAALSRTVAECTSFAALPSVTATGHTLAGQNWDWLPHSFDTVVVLEAEQEDRASFVTVVEAGLLAKTGLNSAGIAVMTNALVTDDDQGQPGVPYHVLLRALFDCETLPEALSTLQRRPRSSSANFLLASRDGMAVDVEAAPGDYSTLFLVFPRDGLLVHANHFVAPAFHRRDVGLWVMPDSPFRLERATTTLAGAAPFSVEDFQATLGDHANHPYGVCCHPDSRLAPEEQGATVASVIVDVDTATVWVSDGNPCSTIYRELDYSELLGAATPAQAA
ncbi:MAG: C45 family peptidase [Actinomycetota bacterium]|nr:C45 family peptidase [Actinomycetota bacterium]